MSNTNTNGQSSDQPLVDSQGQAIGSPSAVNGPSGSKNDGGTAGNQGGPDPQTQVKELRRKLTEMGEERSKLENVLLAASQTPEWQTVRARLNGETVSDAAASEADEIIKKIAKDEGAQGALRRLLEINSDSIRRSVLSELAPTLAETRRAVSDTALEKGLRDSGLNPEINEDPDFKDFVRDFESENTWVKKLPPAARGKYLGDTYQNQHGQAETWKLHNQRIARAKDGTLESLSGATGRQAVSAAGQVQVPIGADMNTIAAAIEKAGGDESKLVFVHS